MYVHILKLIIIHMQYIRILYAPTYIHTANEMGPRGDNTIVNSIT